MATLSVEQLSSIVRALVLGTVGTTVLHWVEQLSSIVRALVLGTVGTTVLLWGNGGDDRSALSIIRTRPVLYESHH